MCWWKKKPRPPEPPKPPPELVLPHPEEPRNDAQAVENADVPGTITRWLMAWAVPPPEWGFWRDQISVTLWAPDTLIVNGQVAAAGSSDDGHGGRHLDVDCRYLNPGVIAHEQCHNSYSLLDEQQKDQFEIAYSEAASEPYIRLLHSVNTYMNTLDSRGRHVEGHAEIGRYIGQHMPTSLKPFYPRLWS